MNKAFKKKASWHRVALTVSCEWIFFMALVDSNLFLVPICSSCCHRTALTLMMVLQRQQQQQHNPFSKSWSHGCVTSLGSWSHWGMVTVERFQSGTERVPGPALKLQGVWWRLCYPGERPVLVFLAEVSPALTFTWGDKLPRFRCGKQGRATDLFILAISR